MYTTIGIALIVFSMVAAEHIIYPWWLLMLIPSFAGGLLIGYEKEKSDSEAYVAEGEGAS